MSALLATHSSSGTLPSRAVLSRMLEPITTPKTSEAIMAAVGVTRRGS